MQRWNVDLNTTDWQTAPEASEVSAALLNGELVAIPTETVYGLAADATNGLACAKIFEAKGRPQFNPLISHVPALSDAREHGDFGPMSLALAEAFWPGPLTLVVPKKETSSISDLATAGLQTVALRVPEGPVMRFLSTKTGKPLAAPSANRSGKISPTRAQDVVADLESSLSFIVDGGPCEVGIESTIVGLTDAVPRLLRPGGIGRESIESVLGTTLQAAPSEMRQDAPSAPGMLESHYAPDAKVILNAQEASPSDALLSFGPDRLPGAESANAEFNLSKNADLKEAASRLFAGMRELDKSGANVIRVQFIPSFGLGEAINDRLRRAAAPR
ncbi:L-threonylcarbamoyladenylate synthase [uncultured Roseibium sp.]|uniref:L-threonylcarbamoyladenylate synthase n=1 Tax=uncultured Roseibium sp. TaxID=1936171 RepID=UPI002631F488|nr:L-threonylcarbamoyladenylate synthase [uncultured Roseibium sp.]